MSDVIFIYINIAVTLLHLLHLSRKIEDFHAGENFTLNSLKSKKLLITKIFCRYFDKGLQQLEKLKKESQKFET